MKKRYKKNFDVKKEQRIWQKILHKFLQKKYKIKSGQKKIYY